MYQYFQNDRVTFNLIQPYFDYELLHKVTKVVINNLNKVDDTSYLIDMEYNSNQYFIEFNNICDKIESIKFISDNLTMDIQDIEIKITISTIKNINHFNKIYLYFI